ncbi:MAG: C10 family peptidase, partial [Bacteroidales bacterium]|nr:C10 family peptidase [Bacteroidales bacterium]
MKRIFSFLFALALMANMFAKPIDVNTARTVATNFLAAHATAAQRNFSTLELVYTVEATVSSQKADDMSDASYFYVFNAGSEAFVIIAGDNRVTPILGYSDGNTFKTENMPPNLRKWLEGYKNEIRYVMENGLPADEYTSSEWETLLNGGRLPQNSTAAVSPLVATHWDQLPYYNDQCPYDNSYNQRTVAGCVATAMAQVMKYWNYPVQGQGNHSYVPYGHPEYGTQSVNFGNTTYQWSAMPNSVTSSNSAVATLMYHCGVAVDMMYDVAANGGSGAYPIGNAPSAEDALKTYFGYKSTLSGKIKSNYTSTNWIN